MQQRQASPPRSRPAGSIVADERTPRSDSFLSNDNLRRALAWRSRPPAAGLGVTIAIDSLFPRSRAWQSRARPSDCSPNKTTLRARIRTSHGRRFRFKFKHEGRNRRKWIVNSCAVRCAAGEMFRAGFPIHELSKAAGATLVNEVVPSCAVRSAATRLVGTAPNPHVTASGPGSVSGAPLRQVSARARVA
jgi:hypothetical protein